MELTNRLLPYLASLSFESVAKAKSRLLNPIVYMRKMRFKFYFYVCIFCLQVISLEAKSVLIVGAGPAGLVSAIEAHQRGYEVILLEKREEYTRSQIVFLLEPSLALLEKWNVTIPHMNVFCFNNEKVGGVQIKYLEKGLEEKIHQLGIKKIQGAFVDFEDDFHVKVADAEGTFSLGYDFVIAADGVHSQVREAAHIPCRHLGSARGVWIWMNFPEPFDECEVSSILTKETYFIRKISVWDKKIIFLQSLPNQLENFCTSSLQDLSDKAAECGWQQEAELIANGNVRVCDNIEILLQQAETFVEESKSVLVIGDAAACGSFFYGKGVNTALLTATIAGDFFDNIQTNPQIAYEIFNQEIKKATDELINHSVFLFK